MHLKTTKTMKIWIVVLYCISALHESVLKRTHVKRIHVAARVWKSQERTCKTNSSSSSPTWPYARCHWPSLTSPSASATQMTP